MLIHSLHGQPISLGHDGHLEMYADETAFYKTDELWQAK